MAYKIAPKKLQGRKYEYVIVDVREADELKEERDKIDGAVNIPLGQLIRKSRERKVVLTVLLDIEEILLQMS